MCYGCADARAVKELGEAVRAAADADKARPLRSRRDHAPLLVNAAGGRTNLPFFIAAVSESRVSGVCRWAADVCASGEVNHMTALILNLASLLVHRTLE